MAVTLRQPGRLIIRDGSFVGPVDEYTGWHALVPVLLGLSVPGLVVALLGPEIFGETFETILCVYLMTIFVVSGVIFVRSVFNPGAMIQAIFDSKTRTAEFVFAGVFGNPRRSVPLRRIADIYMDVRFDDDGYKIIRPLVSFKSDETLELPPGTTSTDIESIRALVGFS